MRRTTISSRASKNISEWIEEERRSHRLTCFLGNLVSLVKNMGNFWGSIPGATHYFLYLHLNKH